MSLSSNIPTTDTPPPGAFGGSLSARERVAAVEAAKKSRVGADWSPSAALVQQIEGMTQAMFPGAVEAEIDCDPSEPDDPWMNFWVTSDLDYAQLRSLRTQWHDAVQRLGVDDPTRFCLLIGRP